MGRHETFTPRYDWLKKGYEAAVHGGKFYKHLMRLSDLVLGKTWLVRSGLVPGF